ncbi:MAG: hypothetical protein CMB99_12515 [Flavobacteriaceae bacterium]|nr:hypothetical protein [Flavobacteriaceae bacterium]|tara:strand:+ start:37141 stop:39741 length:2601 start_codon:yes stop_codon:yes gene_type:complete
MRRRVFLILCFIPLWVFSQCPSDYIITLSSQREVNDFAANYPNCKNIPGDLLIADGFTSDDASGVIRSEIRDLSPLNFIESVGGKLSITISAQVIEGFENLRTVGGLLEINNCRELIDVNGFNSLTQVQDFVITNSASLQTIRGFASLETVPNNFEIGQLTSLRTITGFEALKTVNGIFDISDNVDLTSIPSFNNLEVIGNDLNINFNPKLEAVIGFNKLQSVGNDFFIRDATVIRGFSLLQTVSRNFEIIGNGIESIEGFGQLTYAGGGFSITETSIQKLIGFDNMERVGAINVGEDWFKISQNPNLNEVTGFGLLIYVDGNVEVQENTSLSNCSWLCNLINNGTIVGNLVIQDNLGDCLNSSIVLDICEDDFDGDGVPNILDVDDDNDGILDQTEGNGLTDTDGDGFPDTKDLDADGDDCFDVIEAGFLDPNGDGVLGDLPDDVDISGRIINEPTGYTTPDDKDNNGTYDFLEKSTLDPGRDAFLEVCRTDRTFDLLTKLGGTPDAGGVWSPALVSGTSMFDPSADRAGTYTYTHTNPLCGDRISQIEVVFVSDVNAGTGGELTVCSDTGNVDLFSLLGGNPSPGGYWTPELASGSSIYNPVVDFADVYEYVVIGQFCGTVRSAVTINKSKTPVAGSDNSLTLCEFENPVDLFELLGENVDTNGVWSGNLVNGMFDPSVNPSGLYTYTVDNGPCGIDSASVNVQVIQDSSLSNVRVKVNDFLAKNNNIIVNVYSTREYEYSLDGINYTSQNKFNNVPGGRNTVYVRGANGCEFYSEEVYVRTFPTFFTPNGDGSNDFWKLKDFPEPRYTISIYNRYGGLVKRMNQDEFWDGTLNGKPLNAADFWFQVVTESGEILHGNFSLLRN